MTAPATESQCLLPHSSFGSSDASPQSSSPSHFQRAGMQRPESLQRNSSTPHVIWAAGRETNGRAGGHVRGLRTARWRKTLNRTAALLQLAGSSEPSTQSLSRSQTQTRGMQRLVMVHWNCVGAHVTSAVGGRGRGKADAGPGNIEGGRSRTAVSLILAVSAVVLAVTAEDAWNAAARVGALELAWQANVDICRQGGNILRERVGHFKGGG